MQWKFHSGRFKTLWIKMRGGWQYANTVCSNYPWAIYSLSFFPPHSHRMCVMRLGTSVTTWQRSTASVTDDAVSDKEKKKRRLPWTEMCRLLHKEWKQRTGSDMLVTGRKKKKNLNNLHFGSSHSQNTSQNPPVLVGPSFTCLSKKQIASNKSSLDSRCCWGVLRSGRGNTHTD